MDAVKSDLIVVRFSNKDIFSRLHTKGSIGIHKEGKHQTRNSWRLKRVPEKHAVDMVQNNYTLSYVLKKYVSFPYEVNTLDYILLPKGLKFISFKCVDRGRINTAGLSTRPTFHKRRLCR
ncbi:MAG: hypothetical protein M1562_00345 [Candidatus Marsarchaeota archaeon]|jgi:hypothetical protein|nr:hypothetical protein [Candidatus Marsarchaeota archaeon]